MTVMIVDDSSSVREVIRHMLEETVESFCECNDGSEALATYRKCRPDWVLMDIKMKTMDGFQATREILSSYPDTKVIMITQYNDAKLVERARRAGALEFVLKENLASILKLIQQSQSEV